MFSRMNAGALTLLLLCLLWLAPVGLAREPSKSLDAYQQSLVSLDAEIANIVSTENIPSLSYAIIQPGQPVHVNG